MHRLTRFAAAALAVTGILAAGVGAAPALADHHGFGERGFAGRAFGAYHAVFVQNDRLVGNQIIAYSRSDAGTLSQVGVYDTGGNGGQLEGSHVDHTASQGALSYDRADNLLLAVNAGSNTISVFAVYGDRLALREVISSGGKFPVSVTAGRDSVYVLNAEEGGSIQGYAVFDGRLFAIPSTHRALNLEENLGKGEQFTHTPAQIAFSPDGSKLIVTTKAAGQSIDVFKVYGPGHLSTEPVVNPEPGTVPFGVTFDNHGNLFVVEAGPSALASFTLNAGGTVSKLAEPVETGQTAACWLVAAAGYYYSSNAGSATVTGFESSLGGALLTKLEDTTTQPGTVDAASVGRFLYVQGGKEGTVNQFEVQGNGSLKSLGPAILVPEAEGGEGIVAS